MKQQHFLNILVTGSSGYLGQHFLHSLLTSKTSPLNTIIQNNNNNNDDDDSLEYNFKVFVTYGGSNTKFESAVTSFLEADNNNIAIHKDNIQIQALDITNQDDIKTWLDKIYDGSSDENDTKKKNTSYICIHMAALSSPKICEENPKKAKLCNVPTFLFDALCDKNIPIVALSTDQVYDGTNDGQQHPYKEENEEDTQQQQAEHETKKQKTTQQETETTTTTTCKLQQQQLQHKPNPINVYGKSKLEMEQYLLQLAKQKKHNNFSVVLLRSSIILGPKVPFTPNDAHATFLHFCQGRSLIETTFYTDECRSVISVIDCIRVLFYFIASSGSISSGVYNMGGPQRVSRMDMAKAVFDHFQYDTSYLKAAEKKSLPSQGVVASPLDITMDSTKLSQTTGIHDWRTLQDIVQETFKKKEDETKE